MIGILRTPFGFVDSYNLAINIGIIVSIIVLIILYMVKFNRKKYLLNLLSYAVFLLTGRFFSAFIRYINDNGFSDVKSMWKEVSTWHGSHFLGHVLFYGLFYMAVAGFIRLLVGELTGIEIIEKDNISKLVALTSFALPVQHIFNRLGCLARGCCYGIKYDGIFAIHLTNNHNFDYSVFPCQILEIVLMVILILLMIVLYKKKVNPVGVMMIGFGITFFVSEFVTYNDLKVGGLTHVQITALITVVIGIVYLIVGFKKQPKDSE